VLADVDEALVASKGIPFDFIVIRSKVVGDTLAWAESIRPLVKETTSIVILQNGIGIETPYELLYPTTPVLSGVLYISFSQTSPGVATHNDVQHIHLGTFP
jgi:2-dehydropantoate 2-reductase